MLCCAVSQWHSSNSFTQQVSKQLGRSFSYSKWISAFARIPDNKKTFRNVWNFKNLPSSSAIGIFSPPSRLYRTRTDEISRQKGFFGGWLRWFKIKTFHRQLFLIHIGNNLNSNLCKVVPPDPVVYAMYKLPLANADDWVLVVIRILQAKSLYEVFWLG